MLPVLILISSLSGFFSDSYDTDTEPLAPMAFHWNILDTAMATAFVGEIVYDAMLTEWCTERNKCIEENSLLGPNPSKTRIWATAVGYIIGYSAISVILPPTARRIFGSIVLSIEGFNVYQVGGTFGYLKISF